MIAHCCLLIGNNMTPEIYRGYKNEKKGCQTRAALKISPVAGIT